MKNFTTFLLLILIPIISFGQAKSEVYTDHNFLDNIYTAYFDVLPGNLPIIKNPSERIRMTFDDLDAGVKEYYYKVIHCNKDWEKSDISEYEFVDGLNEYIVEDYEVDEARYSDYTTYSFSFPNDEMNLLISGNYILEIYDDSGDEAVLAIRKRFIYAENKLFVKIDNRPIKAFNYLHKQEVNFSINFGNFNLVSPKQEIFTSVYQNGNWGTGKTNLKAVFVQGTELKFDNADPIVFPGLSEYRTFNIFGLKFTSRYVDAIDRTEEGTDVLLHLDEKRYDYFARDDMNGSFEIYESPYRMDGEEYVNVIFNLKSNLPYDEDIYVFGKLSNWKLEERFKMEYNEEKSMYIANIMLKQGKYDYMYALDREEGIDLETLEGSSGRTLNDYNIVVYYRTLGTDYDRVLSATTYHPFYD